MALEETIDYMLSKDYKYRFIAEYEQTRIRLEKLESMLDKYAEGKLDFEPDCPISLLMKQADCMKEYLNVLKERAKIERIEL